MNYSVPNMNYSVPNMNYSVSSIKLDWGFCDFWKVKVDHTSHCPLTARRFSNDTGPGLGFSAYLPH